MRLAAALLLCSCAATLTDGELADRVGATEAAVRSWEAGAVELPALTLVSVAVMLQVDPYVLLPSRRECRGMVRQ